MFDRCIHVSPVTEPAETRDEIKLDDEEVNGNKQEEKLIQKEIDGFENDNAKSGNGKLASKLIDCEEDVEIVTTF